jgi:hypothetical protein
MASTTDADADDSADDADDDDSDAAGGNGVLVELM